LRGKVEISKGIVGTHDRRRFLSPPTTPCQSIISMAYTTISEPPRECQTVWFAVPDTNAVPEPLLALRVTNKPDLRRPRGNGFQTPQSAKEVALFRDPIVTSLVEALSSVTAASQLVPLSATECHFFLPFFKSVHWRVTWARIGLVSVAARKAVLRRDPCRGRNLSSRTA
jgi:hypothetical protein